MKYVITAMEVSPMNNPPIVVDYGDRTEGDAIANAKSEFEEIWNREKFDWAISHEWNAEDNFGIIKSSDGSELRVDVVKIVQALRVSIKRGN